MAKRTTSATRKSAAPKAGADKTGIPEGLPSATATAPQHAELEPKPVEGGAASSNGAEASIATVKATETSEATGEGETGAPPVAAPVGQGEPKPESGAELPAAPSPTIVAGDSPNEQATATGQEELQKDDDAPQGIVRITSRIEGFRRAGMRHSKTPTIVAGDSPNVQAAATGQEELQKDDDTLRGIVRITCRIDGFRRAGMRHSKAPTDHPIESFSDAQLALLETEPNLTVEYL